VKPDGGASKNENKIAGTKKHPLTTMKNLIKYTLAAGLVLAGLALAQPPAQAAAAQSGAKRPLIRERLKQVADELELTREQKGQLKPILQPNAQKLREILKDQSLSRTEKVAKVRELRAEVAPKVKEILTPEQFQKWHEMKHDVWQKFIERHQNAR
jgi:Spy/CpxP family protein refolding chaperone